MPDRRFRPRHPNNPPAFKGTFSHWNSVPEKLLPLAFVWRQNLRGNAVQANIKAAAVQLPVMEPTQRHQVIQPCFSTLGPLLDMMGIHVL
jgi:hypothetical protein